MINNYGITIVNLRNKPAPEYDLYMGRANKWRNLPGSKWANPFFMKNEGMREEVFRKYKEYVKKRPDLIAALPELMGKRLACWCYPPKKCHVMALVEIMEELNLEYDTKSGYIK
jgi:hypothetical protein